MIPLDVADEFVAVRDCMVSAQFRDNDKRAVARAATNRGLTKLVLDSLTTGLLARDLATSVRWRAAPPSDHVYGPTTTTDHSSGPTPRTVGIVADLRRDTRQVGARGGSRV